MIKNHAKINDTEKTCYWCRKDISKEQPSLFKKKKHYHLPCWKRLVKATDLQEKFASKAFGGFETRR